ncbi:acylglycerol kinase-like protein Mulk [Oratosquilla oratoria]|uniref:acylglycerol kinase-like protein Mulk n=1 Tax=Oratosquilla oratoria TaxID=337810 RepID=UPI003F7628E7
MARVVKIFKTLARHPKKTIFFIALTAAGGNFANKKYEEHLMMRNYCLQAQKYGNMPSPLGEKERHITVLLNPAASEGKGKKYFDKYCAPLLHLSGMKVAVVRTEHEGQARSLMEVMDNTDAVVVAGGDGTLAEVVTGVMRRTDRKEAVKKFPIGILPLGEINTAAKAIWGITDVEPKDLAKATMAIIHDLKTNLDIMEITPLKASEDGEDPKPVYAVSSIQWGAYRDALERKDVYWYWTMLKKYMTFVFSSYKDITWSCDAQVEYTDPCSGCSRCQYTPVKEPQPEEPEPPKSKHWWASFIPKTHFIVNKETEEEVPQIDYSVIDNPLCGTKKSLPVDASEVIISTCNTQETSHIPRHALSFRTGASNISALDFIKEGWSRTWTGVKSHLTEIQAGELTLLPTGSLQTQEGKDRELSIDNDTFEVRPMKIQVKPEALTIYAGAVM